MEAVDYGRLYYAGHQEKMKAYQKEWYQKNKDRMREYQRTYNKQSRPPKIKRRDASELKPILHRVYDEDPEILLYKISSELLIVADGHVTLGYYFYSETADGDVDEGFSDVFGIVRNVTFWSLLPEVPK